MHLKAILVEFRYLDYGDYDSILVEWWKGWRWTPPSRDLLPENGCGGIIASKDGVNICAGFIYMTNSKTAWIEYIVSNPNYKDRADRNEAIELVISVLSLVAKDKGYMYAYTSLKNKHLIEKYNNCGFLTGDSNCQEMIKIL